VKTGSATAFLGVRPGDVIVAVDGAEARRVEAFLGALRQRNPGQELSVTVVRDQERRTLTVRLAGRPT